jgi:hypothetical protein
MADSRGGHHSDVSYVFEDDGFAQAPTDTTMKNFGGNAVLDTFEGSHNAVRVFNAERYAAEVIEQTFDGSWSVTVEGFTEPPWWLAGLFGQPSSSNVAGNLYDHSYDLDNDNDPVPLRLYGPTDGFNEYKVLKGAVVASVSVDQDAESSPSITISGAYAEEPTAETGLTVDPPAFDKTSFTNRDAQLTTNGGDTVGRAQSTTIDLEANTEMIGEIGSENAVDFIPRAWEPSTTWEKILWVGQTVDPRQLFEDGGTYSTVLSYDNGETGDAEYSLDFTVTGSLPNDWTESGRNDPDANLTEELSEVAANATATITTDSATPPGVSP